MVAASKVRMLKPDEYDMWRMMIKKYIQMIDYAMWDVIENGATLLKTKIIEGVITKMPITTAEEKAQRRLEVKARSTLIMSIPNEHQLKFNTIKDAKKLMDVVEKRFSGNAATRKTQRNILKTLDQTFDRLQKLVSQLELLEKKLSQEDVNQKLLRSLSHEWNTPAVVWRNKADLDTMSMYDLYNNLKLRLLKNTRRKLTVNSNETIGFDTSKVECYNCHKRRHFARECGAPRNQDNKNNEISRKSVPVETSNSITFVSCDGLGGYDWSDQAEERPNYALMAFSSSSSDSEIVDNCKKGLGYENYNAVPTPYTGNFMPPIPDLSFTSLDEFVNKPVVENYEAMSSEKEPKVVRKYDDALIVLVNTARQVNDAHSKTTVNADRPMSYLSKTAHSTAKSKAFRVFNSRTRIVEENLHIRFSESIPNVVGSRPDWLFDNDALTKITKYEPIVTGTQSNGFAGTKASYNVGQARKETEPVNDYIFLPLRTIDPLFSQDPKSSHDDGSKLSNNVNSTNNVNTAGNVNTVSLTINATGTNEVNAIGGKISIELPFDPKMSALEDDSIFDFLSDDEDDGAVADMNNLDTTIQVSPILTTRIHKDHPLDHVIEDTKSATQTRKMSKNLEEHGFVSTIQQRTNHKDLQNCLFACFLSQEELKKVIYALKDPSWIEAMQEELLQFKLQEV
nr:ribonuclease H-like domain-containing protein [Tanacetum cinerariifolium]